MKAIYITKYGSPEELQIREVDKPIPKGDEVLIKIHATAINDYDWGMVRGKPYIYRLLFGLFKPKNKIPGMELSGIVEGLGSKVSLFKEGDEVYGDISRYGFGTFAEYICINEKAVVLKPESMTFEEAAALSHASMLAYQGLVEVGRIREGQKILINGAGGGVGTLGLQLAREYQANVTGVDTGEKLSTMKSIGFDHVIDYKKEDFTSNGQQYDLILDAKTNRSVFSYLQSLNPGGRYVTVGGYLGRLLQLLLVKWVISKSTNKSVHLVALQANKNLTYLNKLFKEEKIKPVIDGPYKLKDVPGLIQYFGEGKHKGKVVISISHSNKA